MGSLIVILLLFSSNQLQATTGKDTLTPSQTLTTGQTLVSAGGLFELGFFTSSAATRSTSSFLGIRHYNILDWELIWVANRQTPITRGVNATLSLTADGDLFVHYNVTGSSSVSWSTNTSGSVQNPTLKLLDSGNLVLTDGAYRAVLWQSFDYPSDAFIPGMELGWDLTSEFEKRLISWQSSDDPSPGIFTYALRRTASPELVLWNGSSIAFRTGPWNGVSWSGIPQMLTDMQFIFHFLVDSGSMYYSYESVNKSLMTTITLSPDGELQRMVWIGGVWRQYWKLPQDKCDEHGTCGAFGICNLYYADGVCKCLRGFEPWSAVDWTLRDYSGGCKRRTPLGCGRGGGGGGGGGGDGFVKVSGVKPPDTENVTVAADVSSVDECGGLCLRNCSCVAYTLLGGNCLWWIGELLDIREFAAAGIGGPDVYLRLAASELVDLPESGSGKSKRIVLILVPLVLASTVFCCFGLYLLMKKRKHCVEDYFRESRGKELELPLFDMSAVENATNNFRNENKLGEGGFGAVYKGQLGDGQEIAVKRLSRYSVQGPEEFMNEVMLIAKLQHRNLVRLLGCCIQREERLLIYEYMPNRSVDSFIFDKAKDEQLDWQKRLEIILGIARGLLYLHQDSRLKIVHRDLKLSNVLLDKEMNPKISDFGMARIVRGDQMQENTQKVVGTYGYMSPEYAMHGIFSVKSDVFSFGVIVLEILTGKKNRAFDPKEPHVSLVEHAWRLWSEDRSLELVVDAMEYGYPESEVLRCIQVGLLCVQERSDDRPTIASAVLMLGSEGLVLPKPKRPGFYPKEGAKVRDLSTFNHASTVDEITVTMVHGR